MKINLIAELGLNHLGSENYLSIYQNFLKKKKIDGITIQVPGKLSIKKKT